MIQKNVTIPFNLNLAKKIQNNEIPGRILTLSGYPARIIDFTFAIDKMLVMCMDCREVEHDRVFHHTGEAEDCKLDRLIIQVPEWKTCHNGEVVFCEYRTATASSQWLAILDGEVQYLSNGNTMFWHYADVIIYSTHEPTRMFVQRRASSSQMVINKADASQRRLMAEHLINYGSTDALNLLHKFLPEFVHLLPIDDGNKTQSHE